METVRIAERVISVELQGLDMRAIESYAEGECGTRPVVVFLPSGVKYSAGPYRIFVNYARQLAGDGFRCYRFDPRGIGISEGRFQSGPIHQLWNRIETGCFVEDLTHFIGLLRANWPRRRVVLCGLCGGAVTAALLAGRHRKLVDGIVSINTEVFLSSAESPPSMPATATEVDMVMKRYATKLLSREAWSRLLLLESDVKGIVRTTGKFLLQGLRKENRRLEEYRNINHHLISAFRSIGSGGVSHLLLFSENSSSWHKFQDTFLSLLLQSRYSSPCGEIRLIRGATHDLHDQEHRSEALTQISAWLNSSFGNPESDATGYHTAHSVSST